MSTNASTESGRSGRVEEFSRLLTQNHNRIFGFIYSLVHDATAADDIFQEVSGVLWRKFDRFEPGTDFAIWATSVARLSVFEWRRKQKRVPLPLDEHTLLQLADEAVIATCESEIRERALVSCIEKLPLKDRVLITQRYEKSVPVRLIARQYRRTVQAIYKALNRIHAALLECVERTLTAEGLS